MLQNFVSVQIKLDLHMIQHYYDIYNNNRLDW